MPLVRDITKVEAYNDAMIAIGYEPKGENGLPGRRYFQKGETVERIMFIYMK